MRNWIIFQCPFDGSIVVSKLEGDVATGVAECPDMRTARAVIEAMRDRDVGRSDAPGDCCERATENR